MELLYKYKNGNYNVLIFDDGTKVRQTNESVWKPDFAENIDIKITDKCDGNCSFCFEGCTPNGKHGELLDLKFWDTLHKGQEVAINGNDLSHPDLIPLLKKLSKQGIIVNMTLNQMHFVSHLEEVKDLIKNKLIYGLGVSLVYPTDKLLEILKESIFKNVVIHTINGILTEEQVEKLKNNNLKLLILGYKHLRRGDDYFNKEKDLIEKNQKWLKDNILELFNHFKVVSFDNLALEQLNMQDKLDKNIWEEYYMGDDGTTTFYIDCVNKQFAQSSTSLLDKRYPLLDNIDDMFKVITKNKI